MPELTREEKIKIFEKLPKELQNLMQSEDTSAFLLYLGKKYNLATDKIHLLSKLVGDIVLGITPITSMAQEINSKVISDPQASMHMAQELYAELLAPVMAEAKPATPTVPTAPTAPTAPVTPSKPQQVDQYREPVTLGPEVVDLRKTPPAVSKVEPPPISPLASVGALPISPAPIPPLPHRSPDEGGLKPLTFTKPVEPPATPPPLIEANPHKVQEEIKIPETPKPLVVSPSTPFRASGVEPQFIIRPPGLAPTDTPRNILDLRRDKGEF